MGMAYGISEDDVLVVLRHHSLKDVNTNGVPFDGMAEELFGDLDHDAVEEAALAAGDDMDDQTDAAHAEILRQLQEQGVIEAFDNAPSAR